MARSQHAWVGVLTRHSITQSPNRSLVGDPHLYLAEARRGGSVSGTHRLHGLALAARGNSPQCPVLQPTDGVTGIPELGGDAAVARVFEHARFPAALNFPADLGAKLEVVPAVVDGPTAVGFHVNPVVGIGDS